MIFLMLMKEVNSSLQLSPTQTEDSQISQFAGLRLCLTHPTLGAMAMTVIR